MNTFSPPKDQPQAKKTVLAKVLKKSKEMLTYSKKGGGSIQYFNVIAANGGEIHKVKVYQVHRFGMIRVGMSYKFGNGIEKNDGLWIVSSSTIGFVQNVHVDDDLLAPDLPEDEPATGSKRSLQQALGTTSRSTVHAKIVKVSPVKFTKDGTLPVRCLGLKDSSGYAKVALFEKLAEKTYVANTTVELTGVYQKTHSVLPPQLAVTRDTTCQFLSEDNDVTVDEADINHFMDDSDFQIRDADTMSTFEVESINDVMVYSACTTLACRLKKLKDGRCPNCEGTESRITYMAKLSFVGKDDFSKELAVFEQNLERLFGKFPINANEEDAIGYMISKLPVKFTAKFSGTNMYNISTIS